MWIGRDTIVHGVHKCTRKRSEQLWGECINSTDIISVYL